MNLRRAVITAAGKTPQEHPLQRLVDRDGVVRSALGIIVDEALAAGADEIAVVVRPGDESAFQAAIDRRPSRLEMITQHEPTATGRLCSVPGPSSGTSRSSTSSATTST